MRPIDEPWFGVEVIGWVVAIIAATFFIATRGEPLIWLVEWIAR